MFYLKGLSMEMGGKILWNPRWHMGKTIGFTEEQNNAIDHQIPMTQELFESIIDRCGAIGEETDLLLIKILEEYEDFVKVYMDRIEEEIKDVELPEISEEEWELNRQKLFDRIHAEFGKNED